MCTQKIGNVNGNNVFFFVMLCLVSFAGVKEGKARIKYFAFQNVLLFGI